MKTKTVFSCQSCGYQSPRWLGRCPDCNNWNSFVEDAFTQSIKNNLGESLEKITPVLLKDVVYGADDNRLATNNKELDRVLGGGIVRGSVVLIGGDPGIGKSTICLEIASKLGTRDFKILYVSAEESVNQTKMRAQRIGIKNCNTLYIVNQTDLGSILDYIRNSSFDIVIVDSIQVINSQDVPSAAGSVSQVRFCAGELTRIAKTKNIALFLIGHVTKEGTLAGPRVLEHLVDTVLYFEGDRFTNFRILRAVKNRFGSTNEIGIFEMGSFGLKEVSNPSEVFLSQASKKASGSVLTCVIEGTRPILVEAQSLTCASSFGYAQRKSQGFDYSRLSLLVAVCEKRLGLNLVNQDIFVNIAGGIQVEDPACDLAIIMAIVSSFKDKQISNDTVILGEVGLSGEIRSINQIISRIKEIERIGFKRCVLPKSNYKDIDKKFNLDILAVEALKEAIDYIL
ncbi:MAG: DNA repair protein RadA [Candidatus Omnitrophota bacterium]